MMRRIGRWLFPTGDTAEEPEMERKREPEPENGDARDNLTDIAEARANLARVEQRVAAIEARILRRGRR